MVLKLKNRKSSTNLKKVLVYGLDGSGKSTFATNYCKENNLNPICIDVDDTNYTDVPLLDFQRGNDRTTFDNMKVAINDIKRSEYDTIILDGVSSLLSIFISDGKGINKYGDRATRWNKILHLLLASGKHLIFIGQITMDSDREDPPAVVVDTNSVVNEKYYTYIDDKGQYTYEVKKMRVIETPEPISTNTSGFETADNIDPVDNDPVIENYAKTIAKKVVDGGHKLTKRAMILKTKGCLKRGEIPAEYGPQIIQFIEANCPGGDI